MGGTTREPKAPARAMAYNAEQKETMELRFNEGDRVVCNIGEWAPGYIVKRWYREDSWPEGKWAPYQVQLDQGSLIYAPIDDDKAVRDIKDAPEGVDDAGGRPEPPPPTKSPMTWEEIKAWDT